MVAQESRAAVVVVELLREHLLRLQARNPGYSLRAFARKIQLSPTTLSEVLRGKRPVTRKAAERVLEKLYVDPAEASRILNAFPGRTRRSSGKKGASAEYLMLAADQFKLISEWHHYAILSLAEVQGFEASPVWIAARLGITPAKAASALETLKRLELLRRGDGGKLIPTGKKLTTMQDVSDLAVRKHHAEGLELAREALETVPVELREFGSSTIAIDPDRLPLAKQMLRELRRKVSRHLESGQQTDVYRLSVQLFPLTRSLSS